MLVYLVTMDEFVKRQKQPDTTTGPNTQNPAEINRPQIYSEPAVGKAPKASKHSRFSLKNFRIPTPKTKKQWIIASAVMALLLTLAGFSIYWFIIRDNSPKPLTSVQPDPEPEPEKKIYSRLSGREVASEINARPIYAVQIENSPEARPQSGIKDADIVFEAIAEGGITRFNAVFQDNIPANIGPVRSLRPYYIDWFLPYDAAIVHAGGSGEALSDIRTLGLKDIDHSGSGIFRRVSNRYAPHNLYTSGQQVLDLMSQRSWSSNVTSLPRKEAAVPETPNAKNINLNISRGLYNVSFVYDPAINRYMRSQGGSPHVDADTGEQLGPNVVVVPILSRSTHPDRVHTLYGTVGSGKVYVFQDGSVTEGTWTKESRNSQWKLTDSSGNEIKLNPGQTWFSMVEDASRVSYAP